MSGRIGDGPEYTSSEYEDGLEMLSRARSEEAAEMSSSASSTNSWATNHFSGGTNTAAWRGRDTTGAADAFVRGGTTGSTDGEESAEGRSTPTAAAGAGWGGWIRSWIGGGSGEDEDDSMELEEEPETDADTKESPRGPASGTSGSDATGGSVVSGEDDEDDDDVLDYNPDEDRNPWENMDNRPNREITDEDFEGLSEDDGVNRDNRNYEATTAPFRFVPDENLAEFIDDHMEFAGSNVDGSMKEAAKRTEGETDKGGYSVGDVVTGVAEFGLALAGIAVCKRMWATAFTGALRRTAEPRLMPMIEAAAKKGKELLPEASGRLADTINGFRDVYNPGRAYRRLAERHQAVAKESKDLVQNGRYTDEAIANSEKKLQGLDQKLDKAISEARYINKAEARVPDRWNRHKKLIKEDEGLKGKAKELLEKEVNEIDELAIARQSEERLLEKMRGHNRDLESAERELLTDAKKQFGEYIQTKMKEDPGLLYKTSEAVVGGAATYIMERVIKPLDKQKITAEDFRRSIQAFGDQRVFGVVRELVADRDWDELGKIFPQLDEIESKLIQLREKGGETSEYEALRDEYTKLKVRLLGQIADAMEEEIKSDEAAKDLKQVYSLVQSEIERSKASAGEPSFGKTVVQLSLAEGVASFAGNVAGAKVKTVFKFAAPWIKSGASKAMKVIVSVPTGETIKHAVGAQIDHREANDELELQLMPRVAGEAKPSIMYYKVASKIATEGLKSAVPKKMENLVTYSMKQVDKYFGRFFDKPLTEADRKEIEERIRLRLRPLEEKAKEELGKSGEEVANVGEASVVDTGTTSEDEDSSSSSSSSSGSSDESRGSESSTKVSSSGSSGPLKARASVINYDNFTIKERAAFYLWASKYMGRMLAFRVGRSIYDVVDKVNILKDVSDA